MFIVEFAGQLPVKVGGTWGNGLQDGGGQDTIHTFQMHLRNIHICPKFSSCQREAAREKRLKFMYCYLCELTIKYHGFYIIDGVSIVVYIPRWMAGSLAKMQVGTGCNLREFYGCLRLFLWIF